MSTTEDVHTVPAFTGTEPEAAEPHRLRRGLVWLALGAIPLAVGGAAWLWASSDSPAGTLASDAPAATAAVERSTISATETFDGTLDHGAPFTVASGTEGTITRLIGQGESVERGDELYRVNERPVTLLYGVVPMYRDLGQGDSGVDVKQLEKNLAVLGYDGFTVDDEYGSSTAVAVRAWQVDTGARPTGTVPRDDVVFVPAGRQQVEALRVEVGDVVVPGARVLDLTGTDQVVSLDADIDDRDLFDVDTEVTVVLPGGEEVPGTVATTAVVDVPSEPGGAEGGASGSESILQVEITLDEQVSVDLSGATVDVVVAIDERTDVLLVPVNALLALSDGGYGLEVVGDDGRTSIVPVTTGLFGGGNVQVEGEGITDGTVVGVAGR